MPDPTNQSPPLTLSNITGGVDLYQLLINLGEKTHAGNALVSAAILDELLQAALLAKMRHISKIKKERLFDGFGPLSEFAAKIYVAHAFDLISDDVYDELRIIKNIRDKFAHTVEAGHFRSPEITNLLKKFKTWNEVIDPLALFGQRVLACSKHIRAKLDSLPKRAPDGPEETPGA